MTVRAIGDGSYKKTDTHTLAGKMNIKLTVKVTDCTKFV